VIIEEKRRSEGGIRKVKKYDIGRRRSPAKRESLVGKWRSASAPPPPPSIKE